MSNYLKITFWRFHLVLPSTLGESMACGEPVEAGLSRPCSPLPWAPGTAGRGSPQARCTKLAHQWDSVNRGHEENLEKNNFSFSPLN